MDPKWTLGLSTRSGILLSKGRKRQSLSTDCLIPNWHVAIRYGGSEKNFQHGLLVELSGFWVLNPLSCVTFRETGLWL